MIEFSLGKKRVTEDGYVVREGLIFEAGAYPDKNFELSPEELLAASSDFKPVTLNLEHVKTIFDGKLGLLNSITPSADGYKLFGEAKLPMWFDNLLGDTPIKVSCEWDKVNKTLGGMAITTRPRIKDAVLMSAFSEALVQDGKEPKEAFKESIVAFDMGMMEDEGDRTWAGMDVMQYVHDRLAAAGAVCMPEMEEDDADFVSQREATAIQKMHDVAVQEGKAKCYFLPANYSDKTEKKEMTLIEKIKASFNKALEDVEKTEETPTVVADDKLQALEAKFNASLEAVKTEQEAKYKEVVEANEKLKTELEAKAAEIEKFSQVADAKEKEQVVDKAAAKVEELVKAGKVLPAKRNELQAVFSALVEQNSTVNFNDKETAAIDILFNLFDGAVSLKEEIPTGGQVLDGSQEAEDKSHIDRAKAFAKKNYKKVSE